MGCSSSKEIDAQMKDDFFGEDHNNRNKNNDIHKNEIINAITNSTTNSNSNSNSNNDVRRERSTTASTNRSVCGPTADTKTKTDMKTSTKGKQQENGRPTTSETIKKKPTASITAATAADFTSTTSSSGSKISKKKNTTINNRNSNVNNKVVHSMSTSMPPPFASSSITTSNKNNTVKKKDPKQQGTKYEAPPSSESFVQNNFMDHNIPTERVTNVKTVASSINNKQATATATTKTKNNAGESIPPPSATPPPPPPPPPILLSSFLEENNNSITDTPTTPRVLDDDDFSVAPSLAVEKRSMIAGGGREGDGEKTVTTTVTFDDIYSRGKQLGFGAFANVFVATHKPTGESYAVKEVDRTKMIWNKKNHLEHEIDNMFKVREGPNIVQLYEVYYNNNDDDDDDNDNKNKNKNLCHMVIELMPGGELFERIIQKGKFTEREARDSIRCVLEALNYMHDRKIRVAHRDLKPENLLLESRDRSKLTPVKLADFGFAKSIQSKNSCRSLCGTPGYLAPEILERFPSYDVPCDIWSVGVILFLLLGGYLPFDDSDEKKVFDRTRNAKYYFLPQYWKNVSSGAKDLIANCLTLDPRKRYTAKNCLTCDWMVNNEAARDAELTGVVDKLEKGKQKMRAAVQTLVAVNRLQQLTDDFSNYLEEVEPKRQDSMVSHMSYMTTGTRYGHAKFVEDSPSGKPFETFYNSGKLLGKDDISSVYCCRHKQTRLYYSVKHVDISNLEMAAQRQVKDEITSLKLLRGGPHIIRLLDVFDKNNHPENVYLVFEEMKGGDLLERIVEKEIYTEREARQVCKTVFTAIDYCHKKKVAHRDIKPHNIYLTEEGDDTTVRVGNFGFAKKVTHKNCLQTLCGSAQYVAPEIIDQQVQGYDHRCDIWSLGAFAYVLLAGYVPFEGVLEDISVEILTGKYEFHDEYWADISNSAKQMISSMLVVDPKKRITAAQALSCKWMETEEERLVLRDLSFAQSSLRKSLQPTTKVKAAVNAILARNKFISIAGMFGNDDATSISSPVRHRESSMDMIDETENNSFGDSFLWGEQIGDGTFSVVREVKMKRTNEDYAAKRISRKDLHPSDAIALQNEIEALQKVTNCEYIVTLYDVFDEPDYTFLVLELMKGGDLIDRIVEKQHYTEYDAKEVCRKLLMGVAYCHKKKIANRDLKPENVLLKADSDTDVKISDFGSAKTVTFPNSLRTQCGTEGYVAPEILEHRPAYDVSCDMWSLGVIIYIVLGGYRPFRGEGEDVMRQIRYGDYKFHKRYWGHVSDDAKKLIRSMLTVDPEKRITAENALYDRWIQSDEVSLGGVELSDNMKDLKNLRNAKRKIKAATSAIIATNKLQSIGGFRVYQDF
eukprot:CAMPEP_0170828392 /NCGR_PEP_ID=MMETSP0733-20121128/47892_1 /TAXON_ID=186038 /ORGANISM="Fragilariopsis kerguelensis, Strain L26-C5" /LENGTH=1350 /DNA_ID=CAMNT_0011192863 /DNA_START=48 /DNA_END=4100 /DNA_ORIENTATION=+